MLLKYDTNCAYFAVYDGHGGAEVAKYTALNLPTFLKSSSLYKSRKFKEALKAAFVEFDRTLVGPEAIAEMKKLMPHKGDSEDEEHDPEEVSNLYEEATMPIQEHYSAIQLPTKGAPRQLSIYPTIVVGVIALSLRKKWYGSQMKDNETVYRFPIMVLSIALFFLFRLCCLFLLVMVIVVVVAVVMGK